MTRRKTLADFVADCALTNALDECFDYRQRNVSLKQGKPNLPQRIFDVGVAEPAPASKVFGRLCQAVG